MLLSPVLVPVHKPAIHPQAPAQQGYPLYLTEIRALLFPFPFPYYILSSQKVCLAFIECRPFKVSSWDTEISKLLAWSDRNRVSRAPGPDPRTRNLHSKIVHQPELSPFVPATPHPLPSAVSLQDLGWVGAMATLRILVHILFQGCCSPCLQTENREIEAKMKNERGSLSGQGAEMGSDLEFYKATSYPDSSSISFTLVHNLHDGSCEGLPARNIGSEQRVQSSRL